MQRWRPSAITYSLLALIFGLCAAWSWTHGSPWAVVAALCLAYFFTCCTMSAEEHDE